jgi:hypothetical protein
MQIILPALLKQGQCLQLYLYAHATFEMPLLVLKLKAFKYESSRKEKKSDNHIGISQKIGHNCVWVRI